MKKILFGCILLFASLGSTFAEQEKVLIVSGFSKVAVPAELVEIRIGVETESKTAEEAHERTSSKTDTLVKYLKKQSLLSLQTEAIRLQTIYEYPKSGGRQIKGYVASNTVLIRAKVESAGKLIDESIQNGANQIIGIRLQATDANLEKASQEALQLAAKDARKKADIILSALGLKFKDFVEIRADFQEISEPLPVMDGFQTMSAKSATPIEAGNLFREAKILLKVSY
ncbi:DUF541 domain-containing protein [Leptospira selangorensis]|uniref:DUF541 domain-containing protein n=1 Tax=Leptospira selangorensis TaxID=2484982 RepID=A0A4R9GBY0_9LEPT|nr:SIMPL domain-containing protein [Leptospira selangorensis]TGK09306.1 DUF541 domain-containing protein [Leptospira selangorensis]TGM16035.1 DUF541 domain-containing protein [Leptospira selangorensis]TGM18014.1 DUF541 domain-containing protein [Leptospira selangorensis]